MFLLKHYLRICWFIIAFGFLYLAVHGLFSPTPRSTTLLEAVVYFSILAVPFSLLVLAYPIHRIAHHWNVSHEYVLRLTDRERKILSWYRKTNDHHHDNFPAMTPRLTPTELQATLDKMTQ